VSCHVRLALPRFLQHMHCMQALPARTPQPEELGNAADKHPDVGSAVSVAPADVTFVNTAEQLLDAVSTGKRDIVVKAHLDLTALPTDEFGAVLTLLPSTRSIRVRPGSPRFFCHAYILALVEEHEKREHENSLIRSCLISYGQARNSKHENSLKRIS
jgi:hypothetical protein